MSGAIPPGTPASSPGLRPPVEAPVEALPPLPSLLGLELSLRTARLEDLEAATTHLVPERLATFFSTTPAVTELALHARGSPGYADVARIIAFWYALKLNDLRAALRGWVGNPGAFARTPKSTPEPQGRWAALRATVRATPVELALALGLTGVAVAGSFRAVVVPPGAFGLPGLLLVTWLAYYALAFLAAPVADYRSRRMPARLPVPCPAPARPSPSGASPTST